MIPDASPFPPEVVEAICRHMNDDHADDCRTIVRGHTDVDAHEARMVGLDAHEGRFLAEAPEGTVEVAIPWSQALSDRVQVRAEVVRLHAEAQARLGGPPEAT